MRSPLESEDSGVAWPRVVVGAAAQMAAAVTRMSRSWRTARGELTGGDRHDWQGVRVEGKEGVVVDGTGSGEGLPLPAWSLVLVGVARAPMTPEPARRRRCQPPATPSLLLSCLLSAVVPFRGTRPAPAQVSPLAIRS